MFLSAIVMMKNRRASESHTHIHTYTHTYIHTHTYTNIYMHMYKTTDVITW